MNVFQLPLPHCKHFSGAITSVNTIMLLLLCAGCLSNNNSDQTTAAESPVCDTRKNVGNTAVQTAAPEFQSPPEGAQWHQLAMLAYQRSREDQLTALQIQNSYLANRADRAWRDPQLRLNSDFGNSKAFERGDDNAHKRERDLGASLRFYISNPFVNRWIKKLRQPNARLIQAESNEIAYAIYCETITKCMEASICRDEAEQIHTTLQRKKTLRKRYQELRHDGHVEPLKLISNSIDIAKLEIRLTRKLREQRNLLHSIATLTALDLQQINVASVHAELLRDAQQLDLDELTITALSIRPDLESVRAATVVAANELKVAQAQQIPWFEFAEAGYSNRSTDNTRYGADATTSSDESRDEWMIRTAVSLPIFSWMGGATESARGVLRQAQQRETITAVNVRNEIRAALDNYTDAYKTYHRLLGEVAAQKTELKNAIADIDSSKTVPETETLELKEKLHECDEELRKLLYNCVEAQINLDSVTGNINLR